MLADVLAKDTVFALPTGTKTADPSVASVGGRPTHSRPRGEIVEPDFACSKHRRDCRCGIATRRFDAGFQPARPSPGAAGPRRSRSGRWFRVRRHARAVPRYLFQLP